MQDKTRIYLKYLRFTRGLTIAQAAEGIGISASLLYRIENGIKTKNINRNIRCDIAEFYNISLIALLRIESGKPAMGKYAELYQQLRNFGLSEEYARNLSDLSELLTGNEYIG